jgi:prephenate dehydrogenase
MEPGFECSVTVVGVGLMGGSLCRALREKYANVRITGVDYPGVTKSARRQGAIHIDLPPGDLARAVRDADLVFLAAPISSVLCALSEVLENVRQDAVVTDLCSTKARVCRKAGNVRMTRGRFIGGHPLCGSERSGFDNSDPSIFRNAAWVLTTAAVGERHRGLSRLIGLIEGVGACPCFMSPEEHDRIVARTSHLPQILSTALARVVSRVSPEGAPSGRGLKDMVRIAGSPAAMWMEIIDSNRAEVLGAVGEMIVELEDYRRLIAGGSFEHLSTVFERAARTGEEWGRLS